MPFAQSLDSHGHRTRRRAAVVTALLVVALMAAGCGAGPTSPPPEVKLGAPAPKARLPIEGAAMDAGQRYLFKDVLPGSVDVELGTPDTGLFPAEDEFFAYVAADAEFTTDVLSVVSADDVFVFTTPYDPGKPGDAVDPARQLRAVPPGKALDQLSKLEFLTVIEPARPLQISGAPAVAIDVKAKLPAKAQEVCAEGQPRCAEFIQVGPGGLWVTEGQKLRLIQVELAQGRVLIVQSLDDPRAQRLVEGARFVNQTLPPELGAAQGLPYAEDSWQPGTTYGVALTSADIGMTFRAGPTRSVAYTRSGVSLSVRDAALPPDLRQPSPFGYLASTEKLFGYVARADDLLVPDPGVDPRKIGPTAFAESKGSSAGGTDGLPGVIATQPWAEIVSGPADVTLGGASGRVVEVRLKSGAGSLPCTLSQPDRGSCAVLVYSKSATSLWLVSDRVFRVAEVTVAGTRLAVITSVDDDGRTLADSLTFMEVKR